MIVMYQDPIVNEIHAIRQQIWLEAGQTYEGVRQHAAQAKANMMQIRATQTAANPKESDFEILPPGVAWITSLRTDANL
jgi:hypothetical protein